MRTIVCSSKLYCTISKVGVLVGLLVSGIGSEAGAQEITAPADDRGAIAQTEPARPTNKARARSLLHEALGLVSSLPPKSPYRIPLRLDIAEAYVLTGSDDVKSVLSEAATASSTWTGEARVNAQIRLAGGQFASGDAAGGRAALAAAMKLTETTLYGWPRVKIMLAIAQWQVKMGDHDAARETYRGAATLAGRTGQFNDKVKMLSVVASEQAASGLLDDADQSAINSDRARPLMDLFSGDSDLAVASAWLDIGQARLKAGDITGALANLSKAKQMALSSSAAKERLSSIAVLQFKAGDLAAAQATTADALAHAREQPNGVRRAIALAKLATAQAEMNDNPGAKGSVAAALVAAREESSHASRTVAFGTIGTASLLMGDKDTLTQLLNDTLVTARQIPDTRRRFPALLRLADTLILLRDQSASSVIAEAAAVVKTMSDPRDRDNYTASIAIWQAKAGEIDAAVATARSVEESEPRASALVGISKELLRR